MLRLFGAPLWEVQQAVQQTGLAAQCRSRGAETLAALQTETPAALSKARKTLADRFAAELYGEGEMTLVHAAVQALETHRRLLVCCDADAGTLLEARMETVAGAEKVFDFGAMSYADAKVREKLSAKVCRVKGGPVPAKLTRVRAAQRLVGADFAAGCLERAEDTVLFLGSRKGCWVRTVANADTPALWLLDMIRRAASGLPQAAGTIWQKYGRAIPADALTAQRLPDKPEPDAPTAAPRKRHRVRNALIFLLILALAAFAAAWYYTGGDLAALPQQKASKITKLLCIFLTRRFIHGVILVVFNHDTGKTNSVFLRQLHQIRPPDFAVKVADAHAVISADIGTITAGNRRRKIVQIEHGTVNDRVSSGIA